MLGRIYNPEIETMDRASLEKLQSERLVKTVERVYASVAPYRRKMEEAGVKPSDIKSVRDLHKLPFTVKQDLRDNYPFGMFAAPQEEIVRLHASSGTTGKLTTVGYTQNDLDMWSECAARSLSMAGCSKKSTVHVAYGYGLFTGGLGAHYGAERIGATVVPCSAGNTERQLMLLRDFKANILCCTPSYALYLADELCARGEELPDLVAGCFGAEPWSDEMRKDIERKLGITALDIYGLSEICGPGVAMECEYKHGSHVWEDFFIPEIIDPDTLEPLPYGEKGELVFTTITKEGIPLVRYRTRDITSLSAEPCACGRTHLRMDRVLGRTDDMLIIRGVNVFPSQIETVLLNTAKVEPHYQLIVDRVNNTDTLEVQVEMSEALFSDEVKQIEITKKEIEAGLQSALSVHAKVTLVNPHSIARSEGKAKRIIDNRKF